jgi:hypothetical protein
MLHCSFRGYDAARLAAKIYLGALPAGFNPARGGHGSPVRGETRTLPKRILP